MTPIEELNQAFVRLDEIIQNGLLFPDVTADVAILQLRAIAFAQQQQIADLNERLSKLENKK